MSGEQQREAQLARVQEFPIITNVQSFKMFETTTHHEKRQNTKLGKFEFESRIAKILLCELGVSREQCCLTLLSSPYSLSCSQLTAHCLLRASMPTDSKFIPFHIPAIDEDEIRSVVETLESGWLTTGPKVKSFEEDFARYVGCKHAIAVNSGTAALHLALDAIGIREGDEVIVPAMTFAATAEVVLYFKAQPDTCRLPARYSQFGSESD